LTIRRSRVAGVVLSSTLHTGVPPREVGRQSGYDDVDDHEVVYLRSARVPAAGTRP
jgi:hypothetical protein